MLPGFGQDAAIAPEENASALLKSAVTENAVTGVAAGFSVAGKTKWANGAGYSHPEDKTPFTEYTLTRIASLVKPMTAIAIMQLYEQNKIDLDAPIQQYIPDFPVKAEGNITTRQLLNHTSGVGSYASYKEQENKKQYDKLSDAVAIFKDRVLKFSPGKNYRYTSYGYVILGLIIEKVSGMSYEAYMKKHIWEKAGMQNTGVERYETVYPGKSLLYHKHRKGGIKKAGATNLSDRIPGGGVYSCVADVLKFGNAVLNHTLIQERTLSLMLQDPGIKKKGSGYGLGWTLFAEHPEYGTGFGHTGIQTGVSARLTLLPEQKTTVVVLCNTSGAIKHINKLTTSLYDVATAMQKE